MKNITWTDVAAALGSVLQAVAVIFATFFALPEWLKSRKLRDKEAFETPHTYYTKYEELTVMYPELDMGDLPLPKPAKLTAEQKSQAVGLFLIWLAMIQQAYTLYKDASKPAIRNRWIGWEKYILENMARDNFKEYWSMFHHQFDREFDNYMIELLQKHQFIVRK